MTERVDSLHPAAEPAFGSIGIVGGTGPMGRGLARRLTLAGWAVAIGSRDVDRARQAAQTVGQQVEGVTNIEACAHDAVVVAVPWQAHRETLSALAPHLAGRVVIDAVNPLVFDSRGPYAARPESGSAGQEAATLLPLSTVVAAFHHLSSELMLGDAALDSDVFVLGDERDAIGRVIALVDSVEGLRGVYAGRLRNAGQVEGLTANLIAINRRYRTQAGIRVTGLPE